MQGAGTHRAEISTNIWLPQMQTHRVREAPDRKTKQLLTFTDRHKGGGTHQTERLTNFWLTQTHRGGCTGRKD